MKKFTHGSLFSGIGGFDLAAQWMGWENVFHCEWDEKCQKVLKRHFPNAIGHGNIKETDFTIYANKIDILTGGFPCQPFSTAGKRKGTEDDRHLWPEMLRAIREIAPRWIVGENVYGLVNWSGGLVFEQVCADLENEGYKVLPVILPACAVNAPHRRDRIWFVAYSCNNGHGYEFGESRREKEKEQREKQREEWNEIFGKWNGQIFERNDVKGIATNTNNEGLQRGQINGNIRKIGTNGSKQPAGLFQPTWEEFPTQSPIRGRNDGIPRKLDSDRLKQLGNAIVPQVALQIFKTIEQYETLNNNNNE